jgi:predicted  nucleic acid-binding Zn-ribbon protein
LIAFCSCSSKNELTNILNQFVELNNAMGVQKEDVGVIIANVQNTLGQGKKSYRTFFSTVETQCAAALAKVQSAINNSQQNILDAKSNIDNWKKNAVAATRDVKDAKANIAKGRAQLSGLRSRISKQVIDYKIYASEADKKLNVVKILRDIISDELLNRTPGALVQVKRFHEKLNELKNLLNNNSDSLYSPMISVLLDLATEQNFSDQTVLRKILQNLNNLDKALRDFRTKQEAGLDSEIASLRKQIKNVRGRIAAYRRMKHQARSKSIDAKHYISFYSHEVKHFESEQGRQANNLSLFKKLCFFEKTVHAQGVTAYKRFKAQVIPYLFSSVQRLH